MRKKFSFFITTFNLFIGIFLLIACGGGSNSSNTKADLERDFSNNKAGESARESIVSIPNNLQLSAVSSSGKKSKSFAKGKSGADDSIGINFYSVISNSVDLSNEIVGNLEEFFVAILESQILVTSETGVVIPVEDDDAVTAYMIEDISGVSGEKYKWKLSLYFNGAVSPDAIFRFTFNNDALKGQMLANIKESTPFTINGVVTNVATNILIDVRFDGTSSVKKLDLDFISDVTEILAFANDNKDVLSAEQISELDVGRLSKFSLRLQYDGTEYGISGSGYAAGSNLENELTGEDKIFGDDRSTITFRAKSITGEVDGAKMDIAIPVDTLDNVNTIWETDSFSAVFQEKILLYMNEAINQMLDDTDDSSVENEDLEGSVVEEQQNGVNTLIWFLGENIELPSLDEHGSVITETEYDSAVNFWGSDKFSENNILSVDDLNAIFADTNTAEEDKIYLYYFVMAPTIIAYYQTNPIAFTIADIEAILDKTDDLESNEFQDFIETIKHLVNPGFFEKDIGFLGTFDGTDFYVYDAENNSLTLGNKPSNFDVLNALDLTDLETIIPNDVFNLVLEVK